MAIISQTPLFSWKKVESSPEILRLSRVLRELPDEPIIAALVAQRKGKRNDYPVEAAIPQFGVFCMFGARRKVRRRWFLLFVERVGDL